MAKVHGKGCVVRLKDSSGTVQTLSGDMSEVTLNLTADNPETTSFGNTWRTRIAGLQDWTADITGFYNVAGSQNDHVVSGLMGGSTATCIIFQTGASYASTLAFVGDYAITGPVDGVVGISLTLTGGSDMVRS